MEKKGRILTILYRMLEGESISVSELADQYRVSGKSISRDISEIRTFLAENKSLTGDLKLTYDTKKMFMGEKVRIRFRYTGPSVQAVLDRFPTAEVVKQDEEGTEIAAMVEYSRGTLMELLAQGRWVKVLSPERIIENIKNEIEMISNYYDVGVKSPFIVTGEWI